MSTRGVTQTQRLKPIKRNRYVNAHARWWRKDDRAELVAEIREYEDFLDMTEGWG